MSVKIQGNVVGGSARIRPDWAQNNPNAKDYIKNKPAETTNDDILEWMASEKIITPIASSAGVLYTNNNKILII